MLSSSKHKTLVAFDPLKVVHAVPSNSCPSTCLGRHCFVSQSLLLRSSGSSLGMDAAHDTTAQAATKKGSNQKQKVCGGRNACEAKACKLPRRHQEHGEAWALAALLHIPHRLPKMICPQTRLKLLCDFSLRSLGNRHQRDTVGKVFLQLEAWLAVGVPPSGSKLGGPPQTMPSVSSKPSLRRRSSCMEDGKPYLLKDKSP